MQVPTLLRRQGHNDKVKDIRVLTILEFSSKYAITTDLQWKVELGFQMLLK
jgi:hypothetical protein